MKNKYLYNCESAIKEIPLYANLWMQKYIKKVPIKVPIRRNCLTGSGVNSNCHFNVMELVGANRGNFLRGLAVEIRRRNDGVRSVRFTDHSVWLTPEGSAVDVTAHNYSKTEEFQIFIPFFEKCPVYNLSTIFLYEDYKKYGIDIDTRSHKLNIDIAKILNRTVVREGQYSYVNILSSQFQSRFIENEITVMSFEKFKEAGLRGHFLLPCKWKILGRNYWRIKSTK